MPAGNQGFFVHLSASDLAPDRLRKLPHGGILTADAQEINDSIEKQAGGRVEL
jgi:hypothetical protein